MVAGPHDLAFVVFRQTVVAAAGKVLIPFFVEQAADEGVVVMPASLNVVFVHRHPWEIDVKTGKRIVRRTFVVEING